MRTRHSGRFRKFWRVWLWWLGLDRAVDATFKAIALLQPLLPLLAHLLLTLLPLLAHLLLVRDLLGAEPRGGGSQRRCMLNRVRWWERRRRKSRSGKRSGFDRRGFNRRGWTDDRWQATRQPPLSLLRLLFGLGGVSFSQCCHSLARSDVALLIGGLSFQISFAPQGTLLR